MKVKQIAIIGAAALAAIIYAVVALGGEKGRVRKQFSRVSEFFAKARAEKMLAAGLKIRNIQGLFAPQCELQLVDKGVSGLYAREEIVGYAARAREYFNELSMKFYDLDIAFPAKDTAQISFTMKITGKNRNDEAVNETHQFQCAMQKIDGQWLFTRAEEVEVLKK